MKLGNKKHIAYLAIIISVFLSSFWAFWGINEFFHEGWYAGSIFNRLFLFLVQYMSFAIIFTLLPLISIKYKKVGLGIYIALGLFSAFFFSGGSFQIVYLTLALPFLFIGILFYYGEFSRIKFCKKIIIVPPVLIVLVFGTALLYRNINRIDDKNYGERIIDCQGEKIVWAPRGPGFPDKGFNWNNALEACENLSEDGTATLKEKQNIWRLPSIDEAVKCQMHHNENAGGRFDEVKRKAFYEKTPDKETPLWDPGSEVVYYWTSELSRESENQAYIITYDGGVFDKDIRFGPNTQSFRCIKSYNESTEDDLTVNSFGNDQIEKAITNYLETQKHFSWKTREDSHRFCFIENLKPDKELFPLYVWAYCGEYIIENNELKTISGSSGPVKIDYPNELSYYNISKFSYEAPGDGSDYSKDVKTIFPEDIQEKIFKHDVENLIEKAEKYAFASISNWNDIKRSIAECEIESVMQTHALEVTATFKDGRKIKAEEPEIDDIFEVIDKYENKCGEILMATE